MERIVSADPAQVETLGGPTGKRREEDDNTIISWVARVVGGEGGVAEEARAGARDEADGVDIESAGTTAAKLESKLELEESASMIRSEDLPASS